VPQAILQALLKANAFAGSDWGLHASKEEEIQALQNMAQSDLAEDKGQQGWFLTEEATKELRMVFTLHEPHSLFAVSGGVDSDDADKSSWTPLQLWKYLEDKGFQPRFCKPSARKKLPEYVPSSEDATLVLKYFYISSGSSCLGRVFPLYLQCLANSDIYSDAYMLTNGTPLAISHGWTAIAYKSLINSEGSHLQLKASSIHEALEDDSGNLVAALQNVRARQALKLFAWQRVF
jgi:hypothetical protein